MWSGESVTPTTRMPTPFCWRLNTPGGLVTATQELVQAIYASQAPVITYVAPSGASAASGGFFVLLAGDLAVMAPGTNTGASHPVDLLGGQARQDDERED